MRSEMHGSLKRQGDTDGTRAASGEAAGADIGAIAQPARGLADALPGGLIDLGIAVQSTAHRGLRQSKFCSQVLEFHSIYSVQQARSGTARGRCALHRASGRAEPILQNILLLDELFKAIWEPVARGMCDGSDQVGITVQGSAEYFERVKVPHPAYDAIDFIDSGLTEFALTG